MNKSILVQESWPLVIAQTEHEKVIGKIEEGHLSELKRKFAQKFFYASRVILKHSYRWSEVEEFCNRFNTEERLALEESMRHHPSFKARMTIFFLFGFGVAIITALAFLFFRIESFLVLAIDTLFFGPYLGGEFQVVNYFFLRRKLIRLGGPNAPEDAIREMREICD